MVKRFVAELPRKQILWAGSELSTLWDGTTFIAGLAAMMFYATAMLIGNSVGKNTFRNRKQRR